MNIQRLHHQAVVVDGHADTFGKVLMGYNFFGSAVRMKARHQRLPKSHPDFSSTHINYRRLKQGGLDLQFMAIYTPPHLTGADATAYALRMMSEMRYVVRQSRGGIIAVEDSKDLKSIPPRIGFLISMEGGSPLNGNISLLEVFYKLGVRSMTLTHNPRNELGDGINVKQPHGLTAFGKTVVKTANRLGIILDVAHLAKPGFWDMARYARGPIISSHTGVRALCDIPRNMDDHQIKEIVRRKGVVGIFYLPEFIVKEQKKVSIEDVVDHIAYVADKFGVDYVGLGSDFDGYNGVTRGLEDVACLPNLTRALVKRGFNQTEIKKILGGNFLRVIKQVL
ncbi:MAG: dipeptidase [Planctomycetes bacterium]|nr:dipeptidase [Planctomycetota bacterium]